MTEIATGKIVKVDPTPAKRPFDQLDLNFQKKDQLRVTGAQTQTERRVGTVAGIPVKATADVKFISSDGELYLQGAPAIVEKGPSGEPRLRVGSEIFNIGANTKELVFKKEGENFIISAVDKPDSQSPLGYSTRVTLSPQGEVTLSATEKIEPAAPKIPGAIYNADGSISYQSNQQVVDKIFYTALDRVNNHLKNNLPGYRVEYEDSGIGARELLVPGTQQQARPSIGRSNAIDLYLVDPEGNRKRIGDVTVLKTNLYSLKDPNELHKDMWDKVMFAMSK